LTYIADPRLGGRQWELFADKISCAIGEINRQLVKIPATTMIKEVTAFATEALLTGKCLRAVGSFFNSAQFRAKQFVKTFEHKPALELVSADGQQIKMAAGAVDIVEMAVKEAGVASSSQLPKIVSKTISHINHDEPGILRLLYTIGDTIKLGHQQVKSVGFKVVNITEKYLKHIFGIEIGQTIHRSGLVKMKLSGFHHDYQGILEKSGKIKFITKTTDPKTGVILCDIEWGGRVYEGKTLFPAAWTREKTLERISETLKNPFEVVFEEGRWRIEGTTKEGINIRSIIDEKGNLITSYPFERT